MMACWNRSLRHHAGFTLVELLIVVSIVGIGAGTAIMAAESVQRFAVENAASQVIQALRFGQRHAMDIGRPVNVRFDPAANTVQVYEPDFSTTPPAVVPVSHPLEKKPYLVSLGTSLTGAAMQVQFRYNDGSTRTEVSFSKHGKPLLATSNNAGHQLLVPGTWRGLWAPNMSYVAGDWVEHNGMAYDAVTAHNSASTFEPANWVVRDLTAKPPHLTLWKGNHTFDVHVEPGIGFARMVPR